MLLTKVYKTVFKLIKDKKQKRNRYYSFSCNFPVRYVNECPESKILSLKYLHQQLLIQTSQFRVLARSYLMMLYSIFPIHLNLPIRSKYVLKGIIQRKKNSGLFYGYLRKLFLF